MPCVNPTQETINISQKHSMVKIMTCSDKFVGCRRGYLIKEALHVFKQHIRTYMAVGS